MTEIVLHPVGKGQFRAELDGEILVSNSYTPLFDSCRVLLARGLTGRLDARHAKDSYVAMSCDIEKGATLTVWKGRVVPHVPVKEAEKVGG